MLRQQRKGQGQIGFEFAKADLIDQGRQRLLSRQCALGSKLEVTANSLLPTKNEVFKMKYDLSIIGLGYVGLPNKVS